MPAIFEILTLRKKKKEKWLNRTVSSGWVGMNKESEPSAEIRLHLPSQWVEQELIMIHKKAILSLHRDDTSRHYAHSVSIISLVSIILKSNKHIQYISSESSYCYMLNLKFNWWASDLNLVKNVKRGFFFRSVWPIILFFPKFRRIIEQKWWREWVTRDTVWEVADAPPKHFDSQEIREENEPEQLNYPLLFSFDHNKCI